MHLKGLMLAGLAASLFAVPALAHHSYAMFDHGKLMKVSGVVTQWEYVNPHSWLHINVTGADGKVFPFGFETRSPQLLTRLGIGRDTMKPGEDHGQLFPAEGRLERRRDSRAAARRRQGNQLRPVFGRTPELRLLSSRAFASVA